MQACAETGHSTRNVASPHIMNDPAFIQERGMLENPPRPFRINGAKIPDFRYHPVSLLHPSTIHFHCATVNTSATHSSIVPRHPPIVQITRDKNKQHGQKHDNPLSSYQQPHALHSSTNQSGEESKHT
ncbi:unnamed protein product [Ectocarpus fasciculatus]